MQNPSSSMKWKRRGGASRKSEEKRQQAESVRSTKKNEIKTHIRKKPISNKQTAISKKQEARRRRKKHTHTQKRKESGAGCWFWFGVW